MQTMLIFLAGGLGALCRWWASHFFQRVLPTEFPIGTLIVNIVGCFLFGMIWAFANDKTVLTENQSRVLLTGFVGAFTTFSTFAADSLMQMKAADYALLALNVVGQITFGILAVALGIAAVKSI